MLMYIYQIGIEYIVRCLKMSQFDFAIKKLNDNEIVEIKPRGNSMSGIINSGDRVIIRPPFLNEGFAIGAVVLVKVRGNVYLHLIKSIRNISGNIQYQIGNNRGRINGWVSKGAIYGIAQSVNDRLL